jgi:hypothetical protein
MGVMSEERVITIAATDSGHDASWSPAQEALFRVHSRIVEGDHEGDLPAGNASARLLVYSQQVRGTKAAVRGRHFGERGSGLLQLPPLHAVQDKCDASLLHVG